MNSKQNIMNWQELNEQLWNQGNFAAIDAYIADECVFQIPMPNLPNGPDGMKLYSHALMDNVSNVQNTMSDVVADGDTLAHRWQATVTHSGPLFGIPATGKELTVTGINLVRFNQEGKVVALYANMDTLGMLQQMGALPAMN